ncbi:uncharacterized protein LOC127832185 isoform X2 [Dreissena polymorpha]|uniref:uncharacterized protein LOC127832185 isoform X2 n=1 Tax=Dreissena polymorpha TaxID=45954 RepID=UPI002263C4FC|nr:uncharacterized protein LOC127832185 isoform X2 [Dreissena polymorpha]
MDDYACDICEENEICEEAKFYCEKCSKCYCTSCVEHHYQMHKAHKTLRIERLRNWPFGKGIENESEQSQEHKDQKLTQLCEEHDQLLPTACNVFSHQECSKVKLMADNVTDLQPSPDVDTLHEQLIQKETELENNLPSQDKSYKVTVTSCGVSPDGERIYVTSGARDQLITLSRDGAVISKMTDPVLQWNDILPGMHVTNLGQVLVCGGDSNTILQVNRDGTKRRAILATEKSGVVRPTCVYYSKHTNSIIIGMFDNENILVIVLE